MCAGRGLVYVNRDKSSHIVKCNGIATNHRIASRLRFQSGIDASTIQANTKVSTVFSFILKVISKFSCEFTNNQIGEWVCALNAWRTINGFPAKFPRFSYTKANTNRLRIWNGCRWFVWKTTKRVHFSHISHTVDRKYILICSGWRSNVIYYIGIVHEPPSFDCEAAFVDGLSCVRELETKSIRRNFSPNALAELVALYSVQRAILIGIVYIVASTDKMVVVCMLAAPVKWSETMVCENNGNSCQLINWMFTINERIYLFIIWIHEICGEKCFGGGGAECGQRH